MDNITIRLARPEDAAALVDIYSYYILNTAVTYEYEIPSVEEFASSISRVLEKYPYLIAQRGDEVLGYAYAGTFIARAAADWDTEVSVYIKHTAKGLGLGRRLYEMLESILREQGIVNLAAAIAAPNGEEDEYLTRDSLKFHSRMDAGCQNVLIDKATNLLANSEKTVTSSDAGTTLSGWKSTSVSMPRICPAPKRWTKCMI